MRYFTIFFMFVCVFSVLVQGALVMHRIKRLRLLHDARVHALRGTKNQRN